MSFYSERTIKAVRKARLCDACGVKIESGETALSCAGMGEGDFWSATYHHDCREAERGLNEIHEVGWLDDWMNLRQDMEWEDWPWLIGAFPAVAARMEITTERFSEVQAEQERVRKAWAEADAKARARQETL